MGSCIPSSPNSATHSTYIRMSKKQHLPNEPVEFPLSVCRSTPRPGWTLLSWIVLTDGSFSRKVDSNATSNSHPSVQLGGASRRGTWVVGKPCDSLVERWTLNLECPARHHDSLHRKYLKTAHPRNGDIVGGSRHRMQGQTQEAVIH